MKKLFDLSSTQSAKIFTENYSTSFSLAVKLLAPKLRGPIYDIYGFVRLADEIVDTFHTFEQKELLTQFEQEYYSAYERGISLNPIINAFMQTVKKYNINRSYIEAFLQSMRADLSKKKYYTKEEMDQYIYGSADVVGLMCLKVFVNGDSERFEQLKDAAQHLGSAFQKVNFLRDLKDDLSVLERSYFPNVNLKKLTPREKDAIIKDIKSDFKKAYWGIKNMPLEPRLGVYVAYRYYLRLLHKIEKSTSEQLLQNRIRVSDFMKMVILGDAYIRVRLNIH